MNPNELIEASRRLHAWADNYQDAIGQDFSALSSRFGIDDAERLGATVENMREEGRLLTIGIVGRVKAGKSSLLNALLFDGRPVLPKAATPMTAALTTLSFGETIRAEVQYFTADDLGKIRADAEQFKRRLAGIEKENLNKLLAGKKQRSETPDMEELSKLAERQALRSATEESPSLAASWDQQRRIDSARSGTRPESITGTSPEELASRLMDFVGPDGPYMPFTKSVDIYLPIEWLRDIRIVDTPGMDDPVRSREERTRQLLKDCDVIFIVSPAGQFLNQQDIEAMSLISRREGVRHLAVVASQIDNQLYASAKKATPEATLVGLTEQLRDHMKDTLSRLVASNPEFADAFDDLINGGESALTWTSSACAGLAHRLDEKNAWDATDQALWKNLSNAFPEFFDEGNPQRSRDSLQMLSNIARLKAMIDDVRHRKSEVLAGRLDAWVSAKSNSLNEFKKALADQVNTRIHELQGADAKALERQRLKLQNIASRGGSQIDEAFAEWRRKFLRAMGAGLKSALDSVFEESVEKSSSAKDVESEEYEKPGLGNWFARKLWDGGKEARDVVVVYRQPAINAISHFVRELNKRIDRTAEENVGGARTELERRLTSSAHDYLEKIYEMDAESSDQEYGDDTILSWIDSAVMGVVSALDVPFPAAVNVKREWPSEKKLTGYAAKEFLKAVEHHIDDLREIAGEEMDEYCQTLKRVIPGKVAHVMFDRLRSRLEQLIADINNIAMSRELYARMAKELGAI
ncbi:dynamin family protein [Rhodanobacter sp. 115]|uniref:dynamin family protein n=1 Tax=Rhodanobacter sp. FW021-MT20 TaxID=1162282 RepID=UPI000260D2FD|nr:dynamin family protein [Rhodanobacter sp. 115]EIL88429.1 hypothetical protein UU5_17112 [Rhodanobacter sp. 115]